MKQKVKITKDDTTVFYGKVLNLPIKEDFIIQKSIELFDDEDPCIIHQSYVVKEYGTALLDLFKEKNATSFKGEEYLMRLAFLDIEDISTCLFTLEG
jgi:hypothetical protein